MGSASLLAPTAALLNELSKSWQEEVVFKEILSTLERSFPDVGFVLYQVNGVEIRLVECRGFMDVDPLMTRADRLIGRLQSGGAVDAADLNAAYLRKLGARMAYPFMGSEDLLGLVIIGDTGENIQERALQHEYIKLWTGAVGVALDRARWRRRALRGIGTTRQQELAQLARTFGMTHSLQTLLKKILEGAIAHTAAEKGSLMLLDVETQELVVRVVRGLPDMEVEERINNGELPCVRLKVGQGVAGTAAATGKAEIIDDVKKSGDFKSRKKVNSGALLCVPLMIQGFAVGVLNLSTKRPGSVFDDNDMQIALTIARDAAVAVHRVQLFEQSCTDPQSRLFTGQVVEALLESEVVRSTRYNSPLSVVACHLGPDLSEEVMVEIGAVFRKTMRQLVDMAGHFGDGWFGVVLPETDASGALVLCDRINEELIETVPEVTRRYFTATQWRLNETSYELFERTLEWLEARPKGGEGSDIHRL